MVTSSQLFLLLLLLSSHLLLLLLLLGLLALQTTGELGTQQAEFPLTLKEPEVGNNDKKVTPQANIQKEV